MTWRDGLTLRQDNCKSGSAGETGRVIRFGEAVCAAPSGTVPSRCSERALYMPVSTPDGAKGYVTAADYDRGATTLAPCLG